jgi:hypothetical protein
MAKLAYQKRLYMAKVDESRAVFPEQHDDARKSGQNDKIEKFEEEYCKDSVNLPYQSDHHKNGKIIKATLPDGTDFGKEAKAAAANSSLEPGEMR